jgi:hypothetical protein
MPESSDLSPMTDRVGKGWFSMLCHRSELSGIGIRGLIRLGNIHATRCRMTNFSMPIFRKVA